MVANIKQRDYIQNFCDFVRTFLINEPASIQEMDLVLANTNILIERIQKVKENVMVSIAEGGLKWKEN